MNIKEFFDSLSLTDQAIFAEEVGSSLNYLRYHVFCNDLEKRKIPRKELMFKIADNTHGQCSRMDVVRFFYPEAAAR